ncbi:MAG: bifunctional phosphopantothenoylcysteine decarboxylase/phosphopantothenate--cysteine ligase CoaBC [Pseudohongiellaceae bacterium]
MNSLSNKRILLGISGGIAAYKCAELARLFVRAGAEVRVVMTRAATEFVTPLTLQALSGNRVHLDLLDTEAEAAMGHIELARWADLVLVAPASADILARIAAGRADDLLCTLILATSAPVALAPAMNQVMWNDVATQQNLAVLKARGFSLLGPGEGDQACGEVGPGRMLEPAELLALCAARFESGLLAGRHLLITAGPTREAIDPVRFISNHSSGKMAFALAEEAVAAGAHVTLVSGPVALPTPDRVKRIDVTGAEEMLKACLDNIGGCEVFIGVAAVADYRPAHPLTEKIKKSGNTLTLELVKNPDIISQIAALPDRPMVVGFAAETSELIKNGRIKLKEKNLDLLFANNATETFDRDSVTAIAISKDGEKALPAGNKHLVARTMIRIIAEHLEKFSK